MPRPPVHITLQILGHMCPMGRAQSTSVHLFPVNIPSKPRPLQTVFLHQSYQLKRISVSRWLLSCQSRDENKTSECLHPVCVSEAGLHQRRVSLRQTKEEEHQTGQTVSSAETSRSRRFLHRQPGRHQTVRLPQLRRRRQSAAGQHLITRLFHRELIM